MEDQSILGCVMFSLQGTKESLFSSQDLNRRRGCLGKVNETTTMSNQPGTDELAEDSGKVRGDGGHTVAKVLKEFGPVLHERDDLRGKRLNVM